MWVGRTVIHGYFSLLSIFLVLFPTVVGFVYHHHVVSKPAVSSPSSPPSSSSWRRTTVPHSKAPAREEAAASIHDKKHIIQAAASVVSPPPPTAPTTTGTPLRTLPSLEPSLVPAAPAAEVTLVPSPPPPLPLLQKTITPSSLLSAPAPAVSTTVNATTTIVIRRMSLRDVAAVFHIGEDTFTSERFPQLYRTWSAYEVTDTMATDPELCFVAEEVKAPPVKRGRKPKLPRKPETRLVGFVLATIQEKRKKELSCGYLGWVAVDAQYQRQGIGTSLVNTIEALLREDGIRTTVADTPQQNLPARKFLEKLGFGNPVNHVYMSFNMAKADEVPHKRSYYKKSNGEQKVVKIRQVNIDDLAAVHELGEQVFKHSNLYQMWSEAEVVELFGSDSDNCFVAEVEGTFVGFTLGTTIEKRHSSWRYGYLLWLGVSPQAQRLGVGKKLFHAFQEAMVERGCRLLLCDTQADNLPARAFFERNGFGNVENHVYYSKPLRATRQSSKQAEEVVTVADDDDDDDDVADDDEEEEEDGERQVVDEEGSGGGGSSGGGRGGGGAKKKKGKAAAVVKEEDDDDEEPLLPQPTLLRLRKAKGKLPNA